MNQPFYINAMSHSSILALAGSAVSRLGFIR